jgi:DNA-binding NarL/FixJ family response regulator
MKDITPDNSVSPIYLLPLTPEEIAEREEKQAELESLQAEQEAKVAARQSALAKLAALGLTEEEIATL